MPVIAFLTFAPFASFARTPSGPGNRLAPSSPSPPSSNASSIMRLPMSGWRERLPSKKNWMIQEHASDRLPNLCVLCALCANHLSAPVIDSSQARQGQRQSGEGACPIWRSIKKKTSIFNGLRKPDTLPRVVAFTPWFSEVSALLPNLPSSSARMPDFIPIRLKLLPLCSMPFSRNRADSDLQSKNHSAPSRYGF